MTIMRIDCRQACWDRKGLAQFTIIFATSGWADGSDGVGAFFVARRRRKRRETHIAGAVPPARLHAPSGAVVDDPTAAIALNLAAIGVAVPTIAGVRRRSSGSSASSVKWIQRYTAQPSGGAQVPRVM